MKIPCVAAIVLALSLLSCAIASHVGPTALERVGKQDLTVRFDRPAEQWIEALPVGNGRLGAMVFGGYPEERIQLNEDTI